MAAVERQEAIMSDTIEKISVIISKGTFEGIYPGLIITVGGFYGLAARGQIIFT